MYASRRFKSLQPPATDSFNQDMVLQRDYALHVSHRFVLFIRLIFVNSSFGAFHLFTSGAISLNVNDGILTCSLRYRRQVVLNKIIVFVLGTRLTTTNL